MYPTNRRVSPGSQEGQISRTIMGKGNESEIRWNCSAFDLWSSRRHGRESGSVPERMDTCRQPESMPRAESSTNIIRTGEPSAMKRNLKSCFHSLRPYLKSAHRLMKISDGRT